MQKNYRMTKLRRRQSHGWARSQVVSPNNSGNADQVLTLHVGRKETLSVELIGQFFGTPKALLKLMLVFS
jgi:hypothetical protein